MPTIYLTRLFEALSRGGIDYCVLRNFEQLPERIEGDVDLLVRPEQMAAAEAVVQELLDGYRLLRRVPRNGHLLLWIASEAEIAAAARDGRSAEVLLLDLVTEMQWKGVAYLDTADVLGAATEQRGMRVSGPCHRAVHLVCHSLLDKGRVKPEYRRQVLALLETEGPRALEPLRRYAGSRAVEQLREAFAAPELDDAVALRARLIRALLRKRPAAVAAMAGFGLRKALRIARALVAPPGILVATAAPDGAGKSTLIARVRVVLEPTFEPVLEQYMGWKEFVLPTKRLARTLQRLLRRLRGKRGRPGNGASASAGEPGGSVSWTHNLSVLHYLADLWARYLLRIRPVLARGGLVVCDRYFYDVLVQGVALCSRGWSRSVLLRLIPRPTITILFAGDPAFIAARKKELSADETARHLRALSVLKGRVATVEVQADAPVEENASIVLARLLR